MIPSQKLAMASPDTVTTRKAWSSGEFRQRAESTPSGTPTSTEMTMATSVSSMVAGSRCVRSSTIGRRVKMLVPMSPRASRATYCANCTGNGRSYPSCRRSSSTCAGVAVSPATNATGSAGITREMKNVTTSSPSSVGTNHTSRWSTRARSLSLPALLDHLVGAHQHRSRHSEAQRLGGLEVDDQLEGRRLLDRQIRGLGALEDLSRVSTDQAKGRNEAWPIADQAAGSGEFTPRIARRNGTARCQRNDLLAPAGQERIRADDERAGMESD